MPTIHTPVPTDALAALQRDMWFAVPGMYGGFHYVLQEEELVVKSWRRVVGGSGQTHRITADGYRMTEAGHV